MSLIGSVVVAARSFTVIRCVGRSGDVSGFAARNCDSEEFAYCVLCVSAPHRG